MPRDGMDGDGMGDDLDAVFSDEPIQAVEEVVEQVAEPVVEPETVIETPAEEAPQVQEEKSVPLATFLDMRDKQKDADRRAADLERQLAEARAAQQPQTQGAPDPFDDPQGFAAHNQRLVQEAIIGERFSNSEERAVEAHGKDVVDEAVAWAVSKKDSDPSFVANYMQQRHPVDWIVRQHKRDSLMQQVGEDPDEFVRRRAAELGLIATTPTTPAVVAPQITATTPKAPPKSLVNAPSHGGVSDTPVGKLAGLDAVFPG